MIAIKYIVLILIICYLCGCSPKRRISVPFYDRIPFATQQYKSWGIRHDSLAIFHWSRDENISWRKRYDSLAMASDSQIAALNKEKEYSKTILEAFRERMLSDSIQSSNTSSSSSNSTPDFDESPRHRRHKARVHYDTMFVRKKQSEKDIRPSRDKYFEMKGGSIGDVVFYCPSRLREGETEKVIATLGKFVDITSLKNNILDFVNDTRKQRLQQPITEKDIVEKKLDLLDSVDVELDDPSNRIAVVAERNQIQWRKLIDSASENWGWYITPKENEGGKADVSLYLTVWTKGAGAGNRIFSKPYIIHIELPETIWQAFLRKMRDIGWVFVILGSSIGFLVGKRKKKDDKEAGETLKPTE